MKELTISKNDAGQRLDKFLTKALCNIPPALLYKAIRTKKIKVNRHRAEGRQMLAEGDTLQLFLSDEFFPRDAASADDARDLSRIRPNLSIVYEDAHILLLNKRPGVLVHEDEGGRGDTLITHVQAYLFQKGEYDPQNEQSFAPALCNRIDRNTGGIVIAAKDAETLRIVNEKIKSGDIHKYYLCAVHGVPLPREALLTGYLIKNAAENTVRVYDKDPGHGAKDIRTRYRVIATHGDLALCEIALLTGRTHQIRAHMAHIGHPLLGDGKYGINRDDRAAGYKFQALYAYRLEFGRTASANALSYLEGRSFEIPREEIYFTEIFC